MTCCNELRTVAVMTSFEDVEFSFPFLTTPFPLQYIASRQYSFNLFHVKWVWNIHPFIGEQLSDSFSVAGTPTLRTWTLSYTQISSSLRHSSISSIAHTLYRETYRKCCQFLLHRRSRYISSTAEGHGNAP